MLHKLHHFGDHIGAHHALYPVVRAVGELGQGPAAVGKSVHIIVVHQEVRQTRDTVPDLLEVGGRFASAQVGEYPRAVLDDVELFGVVNDLYDGSDSPAVDHDVPELGGVARYVADTPQRLFLDLVGTALKQFDQNGDYALIYHHFGVFVGA